MAVKSNRVPAIREPRDTVKEMHRSREVSVEEWQWPSVESVDQTHQGPSIGDWLQSISAVRGAEMLSWKNKMLHCLLPHRHAHPHTYKHIYKHIMCQDADKQKQTASTHTNKRSHTNKTPQYAYVFGKCEINSQLSTYIPKRHTAIPMWVQRMQRHTHQQHTEFLT